MPKHLVNAQVKIDGITLSNFTSHIEITMAKEKHEVSGFAADAREFLPGISEDEAAGTFWQSYGSNEVHRTLYPLYTSGSQFPIEIVPTQGSISIDNPVFRGTVSIYEYQPINGDVQTPSSMDVTFVNAVPAGITAHTI